MTTKIHHFQPQILQACTVAAHCGPISTSETGVTVHIYEINISEQDKFICKAPKLHRVIQSA